MGWVEREYARAVSASKESAAMDYRKAFRVKPGSKMDLDSIDAGYKGKH